MGNTRCLTSNKTGFGEMEGSVQAACALGLQLSCCACPDADAGLQMGDCEPVADRMVSRGPRQDSYVDPRGMSELRVTRPRLTLTWKLDVCDCCDAGVGRGRFIASCYCYYRRAVDIIVVGRDKQVA